MGIKYIAEISHVQEVSLLGTADLAFWADKLAKERLTPATCNGRAQLVISANASRFRGIRFRELAFAVLVQRDGGRADENDLYLVQALNTSRLFAFVERSFFGTPYVHGDIEVEVHLPAFIQMSVGGQSLLRAEMPSDLSDFQRDPVRIGTDGWEGRLFLPSNDRRTVDQARLFFARLAGHTRVYPYSSSQDRVSIEPSPGLPVLQELIDSGFSGKEWNIREDATHARSKSFKRSSHGMMPECPKPSTLS